MGCYDREAAGWAGGTTGVAGNFGANGQRLPAQEACGGSMGEARLG